VIKPKLPASFSPESEEIGREEDARTEVAKSSESIPSFPSTD
jgi:hypothetical protein